MPWMSGLGLTSGSLTFLVCEIGIKIRHRREIKDNSSVEIRAKLGLIVLLDHQLLIECLPCTRLSVGSFLRLWDVPSLWALTGSDQGPPPTSCSQARGARKQQRG